MSNWKVQDKYYFGGSLRDISEQKRNEELLKKSEDRFSLFMNNSPAISWMKDEQGRIVYLNKTFEDRFSVRQEDWLGKTDFDLWPPQVAEGFRKNDLAVLASKNLMETIEEAVNPDGSLGIWMTYKFPFTDADENTYIAGFGIDISVRKQQEEAVRESEERFRSVAETSADGILIIGQNGTINFWNNAAKELFGYEEKEVLGKSYSMLIPERLRGKDDGLRQNFLNTGRLTYNKKPFETMALRKDGSECPVEATYADWAIKGQHCLSVIIRDITERKQMEEQLRKSHAELEKKVKERTAELREANEKLKISQDYLKKFAGMLLSVREDERKNIATTIHDELGSMAIAVDSQISIAKEECNENNKQATFKALTKAQAALRKAVVDLRGLAVDLRPANLEIMGLNAALTDFINRAKEQTKLKIIFRNELGNKKIPEDMAIVIYRVIQEALTNITKHAKAQKVSVRLHADKNKLHLEINDDGIGFEVDKVSKRKGKLKIGIEGMRERVEALGGDFIITSAPKRGSQLKAVLPKK